MVIGIDASRANLKKKTGTEWYSFYLIKNLAEIDTVNKYKLYLDRPISEELLSAIKHNSNFSFEVLNWPLNIFWTLGRLSWEMLWHAPDVLFVPAHGLPLIHPRRTINTIHDIAFVRESSVYRSESPKASTKSKRRIARFLIKLITFGRHDGNSLDYLKWSTEFALRHASQIITVSNFTKQEILSYYSKTKESKIKVVYNGYPSDLFNEISDSKKAEEVLQRYDLHQPYFLYVGRLERKKNTPYLIEALSIIRSEYPAIKEKLVLIGNASYGYDEVKYSIEEFDLGRDVIMPGWVEEADLPYIFKSASAFIFPTRHEGFGIPVLQALACGIPTAASDLPVIHEIAGDSVLYFDYNDKKAIAEAMAKITTDSNLRKELAKKGLEQAKKFSWLECAKQTLEVLENKR
jgi:glycosyltransferase involved in cell wall biosynthesis